MSPFVLAVHGRTHKRVVMVVSAQSGKTESFMDLMGERLDTSPVPIIYVGPSKQFLQEQFEPRLEDLMTSTCLRDRLAPDSKMTKTRKFINGVPVRLAHGGSSTAMKSDPFGLALTDEVDEMVSNLRGQGNPVGLIDARGDTYADFVHAVTSTPSEGATEVEIDEESGLEFWADADPEEIKSTVWRLWLSGTRFHWAWPCPHCEEYFIPRFTCLAWDKPVSSTGRELPSTAALAKRTAHLVCPRCGGVIEEGDDGATKAWMNERGVYVAPGQHVGTDGVVGGLPPESWTLSYWVSGLASPFVSWGDRAARYVEAVRSGDPGAVQSVKNQGFGELWSPAGGEAPEWTEVQKCALKTYSMGEVPDGARVLTLACDVQRDRLIYSIRGWGAGATSWLVEAEEIFGPTEDMEVWDTLGEILTDTYDGIPIRLGLIDSGFRPGKKDLVPEHRVYAFARRFKNIARATKGSSSAMRKPIMTSNIDINIDGKVIKRGLELVRLDTDYFKSWVLQKVRWDREASGAWFLPSDVGEDYCRQIVSESRIRAPGGKTKWVRVHKDNHFLDVEAMQAAAAAMLNLSKLRDGPPKRRQATSSAPPSPQKPEPDPPTQQPKARRPGGHWSGSGSIW